MTTDLTGILDTWKRRAENRWPYLVGVTLSRLMADIGRREGFVFGALSTLTDPIILTYPEELGALPVGAVVLDAEERVWTRLPGSGAVGSVVWRGPDHTRCGDLDAHEYLLRPGPVELIRLPKEEA